MCWLVTRRASIHEERFARSAFLKVDAQAVIVVSGNAAASANESDFGLCPHKALITRWKLGIGALPGHVAGVVNLVAHLEAGDALPDRLDDTGGVPAEDLGFFFPPVLWSPHLGVDRIKLASYPRQNSLHAALR